MTHDPDESFTTWEERLVERVADRVREDFKRDAARFVVRSILRGAWKLALTVGLWELSKFLGPKALDLAKAILL